MHFHRTVLAAVALALFLPAQSGDAKPTAKPPEYEKLVADWSAAKDAFTAAQKELMNTDAYKAAQEKRDREALTELSKSLPTPDAKAFGERALAGAKQYAGDQALLFLTFAADNFRDGDVAKRVVAEVTKNHIGSQSLDGILENAMALSSMIGPKEGEAFLKQVVAENKHALPRAWAMYWSAVSIQRNKQASDDEKKAAEQMLEDAENLAEGTPLAERIAAPRFEQEHLQIGMAVPDIAGEDVDGVAFKLSDYRGKVVVLDFWGFW